ncbi:(2Fe-2S)-binding protein [Streptomyces fradiae]|uniref:(2Fe-2S)-binding protein n=1 Tax=Streptomyces fradiae TaxID=1906 RepID=UPI002941C6C9|nr:(2Fe-2S)-binding protein [Streptomyces fradiae]WOI61274.1 (2Fe-2S)-binding protein [Streptomyces fradiae]
MGADAARARAFTAAELGAVSAVGGFFVLAADPPGPGPYIPLADVYAGAPHGPDGSRERRPDGHGSRPDAMSADPGGPGAGPGLGAPESGPDPHTEEPGPRAAPLARRVALVAERLGTPEYRVAASIAQLGLAARLWSVALGAAALHGAVPDLSPGTLHWDPTRSTPDELWWSGTGAGPATAPELLRTVQHGHLEPLAAAFRAAGPVSPGLLRGNSGSALGGAVRELTRWAERNGRPDAARRAAALAAELLDHPDLAGTLQRPALRRRTCCLYYRCPGGGLCGDCVFDAPPRRAAAGPGLAGGASAP